MKWILDDDSSIEGISSMDGIELSMSTGERRAVYYMASSVPRTSFKVQVRDYIENVSLPELAENGAPQAKRNSIRPDREYLQSCSARTRAHLFLLCPLDLLKAGSNLDASWLPGFDQRFECQRLTQGQRVVGGCCTWYTN